MARQEGQWLSLEEALTYLDNDNEWRKYQVNYPQTLGEHPSPFAILEFDVERDDPHRIKTIKDEGTNRDPGTGHFRRLIEFKLDENGDAHVNMDETGRIHMPRDSYTIWMSDSRAEIIEHKPILDKLWLSKFIQHKRVLINGLGLGMIAQAAASYDSVDRVDVIESNQYVIDLMAQFMPDKVNIITADALEFQPERGERWDLVWHDIWPQISDENIPQMDALKQKFRGRCGWQGCWQESGCRKMASLMRRVEAGDYSPQTFAAVMDFMGGKFHL